MFRYTYLGYYQSKDVSVKECAEVYFSMVRYYKERVFVYIETAVKELDIESVLIGGAFKIFPDGRKMMRMEKIFHCDDWKDDSILTIPINERRPRMHLMTLEHDDGMLAYIGHHYVIQEAGDTTWNRYYSIYCLGNTLISVSDWQQIAAPKRPSAFEVDIKSIIEATNRVITPSRIPHDDGIIDWKEL